ncbi:hypothetical protein SAMN04487773_0892 [Enterobacter sp. kpr-6]|nr:hypothetical protein SAMN04487773_0892 [Enterobacter sp. kpr-6]
MLEAGTFVSEDGKHTLVITSVNFQEGTLPEPLLPLKPRWEHLPTRRVHSPGPGCIPLNGPPSTTVSLVPIVMTSRAIPMLCVITW